MSNLATRALRYKSDYLFFKFSRFVAFFSRFFHAFFTLFSRFFHVLKNFEFHWFYWCDKCFHWSLEKSAEFDWWTRQKKQTSNMCYWSVLVTGDQSEALNLLKCQRIGWCEWQGKPDMQGLRLQKKLALGKNGHEFQVNVLHPFPNSNNSGIIPHPPSPPQIILVFLLHSFLFFFFALFLFFFAL